MNTYSPNPGIGNDTIAAVATPAGAGGIGIVRMSGDRAVAIAAQIYAKRKERPPEKHLREKTFPSHRLIHGYIKDIQSGHTVDEVLLVVMRAPHSYTREDVVEIQSHGGGLIVSRILDLVIQQGARIAEPGEFTRRAFLNGRLDLSQAEAVADIINAKSTNALAIASHQLHGGLKDKIGGLREELVRIIADIEADIEFAEDVGVVVNNQRYQLISVLEEKIAKPIEALIHSYRSGRILREGLRLVIVGRPNVGKSSLMNRLVGKEKAIVTPIPGTTRDTVEEQFHIGNVEMHVADTAGLHDSSDPVEVIGMQKTKESIAIADFVLLVVEAHQPIQKGDIEILDQIDLEKTIIVRNKIDLVGDTDHAPLPLQWGDLKMVPISAKKGSGIDILKKRIVERCITGISDKIEESIVANVRHKNALEKALSSISRAIALLCIEGKEDLVSLDLTQTVDALDGITGDRIEDGVLDAIFKQFCIGK